jgi:hypothetical protein
MEPMFDVTLTQAVLSRTSLGPNRIAQGWKQILLSQDAPVLFDQPMFHRPAGSFSLCQVLGHITNPIPKLRFQRRLLQQSFPSPVIHCAATAQGQRALVHQEYNKYVHDQFPNRLGTGKRRGRLPVPIRVMQVHFQ